MSTSLTDADLDRWEKFLARREQPNECVAALTNATQLRLIAEVRRLRGQVRGHADTLPAAGGGW